MIVTETIRRKTTEILIIILCVVTVNIVTNGIVYGAETEPYNIILSWTDNTSESQTVSWTINSRNPLSYVKYIRSDLYNNSFDGAEIVGSICLELDKDHIRHEAKIEGLDPETTYIYIVGSDDLGWSKPESFKTGSDSKECYNFIYLGDAQYSNDMIRDNAEWGDLLSMAYMRNPDLAFGITGGDMVNNGKSIKQWESILNNASPVFSKIPLMTSVGNHECFEDLKIPAFYKRMMALPGNGPLEHKEEFYSFDYGNTHFTVLNSSVFWIDGSNEEEKRGIDQEAIKEWIKKDLFGCSAKNKIVVLHHPPYKIFADAVSDRILAEWVPIFEEGSVDLVFCGHQHQFMRTYPMYKGAMNYEKGITYIMGFSGSKTYEETPVWYAEAGIGYVSTYQIVTVNGNGLRVATYDHKGQVLDKYYISNGFRDVSPMNWFSGYVGAAVDKGILNGTSPYTFEPKEKMTRAMMASMLARLDDTDTDGYKNKYSDVSNGKWYTDAISWASENDIVTGVWKDGDYCIYAPTKAVTREQMAVMFYNYAFYKGFVTHQTKYQDEYFKDSERISKWAKEAVEWCVENGLLKGRDDGNFYPRDTASRAEVAVLLSKYFSFEDLQNEANITFNSKSPA